VTGRAISGSHEFRAKYGGPFRSNNGMGRLTQRSHPECEGEDDEDRCGEQPSEDRIRLLLRFQPLRARVLSAFRGGRPLAPGPSFLAQRSALQKLNFSKIRQIKKYRDLSHRMNTNPVTICRLPVCRCLLCAEKQICSVETQINCPTLWTNGNLWLTARSGESLRGRADAYCERSC
jgi:hypothetical protein